MIPGKVTVDTCGQTINLRLPDGLLVSIVIEGTVGGKCDDQKRSNGHHTATSCGTTIEHHKRFNSQMQAFILAVAVETAGKTESALVHCAFIVITSALHLLSTHQ